METLKYAKKILLWVRLGKSIHSLNLAMQPDDPFDLGGPKPKDPPEVIIKRIEEQTHLLQSCLSLDPDPAMQGLRKVFGIIRRQKPRPELVQILSLILFHDLVMRGDNTSDSTACESGVLFSPDLLEGRLIARSYVAELIDQRIATLYDCTLRASANVYKWVAGDNILLIPGLSDSMVKTHFARKAATTKKQEGLQGTAPPLSPKALFNQMKEYVVSNDSACRLLSVRGSLHLHRRDLLRNGVEAGSNECILLIGQSGTGKTHIAETFGKLCGLPFCSLSASNFTATGYVGLDPDDALKTLIRSAGDPKDPQTLEKARYGVLFMDEWDKRRSHTDTGLDVAGSQVQYEYLRLISGTKLTLGARRYERDEQAIEFNSNGTFFVFAGAFAGLDQIVKRLAKTQSSIGFGGVHSVGGRSSLGNSPKIYDALQDYGLIPEFLNRVTAVIAMKPLDEADLIQIATSQHGVIQTYNSILAKQGLTIAIDQKGLAEVAAFCVETKLFARGIRLVVSALIEDLVFNEAKGKTVLSVEAVRQAIGRVVNMEGMAGMAETTEMGRMGAL
jgi:ATP-dependent Clp protease ATP-binding subunit ClpX